MEISYADKSHECIGWYNLMQGGIYIHYNKCQKFHLKEGTSNKMGINRSKYFISKILKWYMTNGCIGMDWYMSVEGMV